MKDYLLFIDTEASQLPKDWSAPYSKKNNWPYAVQVSWVIYRSDGSEVKYENFYVGDNDFTIKPSAVKVHGITRPYLDKVGINRKEILAKLTKDIADYNPLVVGHFMELDYHVLSADYYRSGMENALDKAPMFCTMLATKGLKTDSKRTFLKLCDVYSLLFNDVLNHQHNAIVDARATAECFFELVNREYINDEKIEQQNLLSTIKSTNKKNGCSSVSLIFILVTLITSFTLWILNFNS